MYRNAYWSQKEKCIKLRTWTSNGDRVTIDCSHSPYVYVDSPYGNDLSIFNEHITKKEFKTPFDRTKFITGFGSPRIYENFEVTQQFLLDAFWSVQSKPEFSQFPLRILFFDIEVDPIPGGEFPKPEEAKAEINIITAYDTLDKTYHVFSKKDYTGNGLIPNTKFVKCANEKEVLRRFIDLWKAHDYVDIATAWNLNGFDLPYIINRITKVLGTGAYYELSPYEDIRTTEDKDKMGRDIILYHIGGVTVLDMIDVYMKFKIVKQESYKLDYIADMELGIGKVDYEGMTIYEFMEKDWNTFVEYNVRDVELLVKLEDKTRYFKILRMIGYIGLVNFEKVLGTIAVTNGALAVRARAKGLKLHTFIRPKNIEGKKPGGFVYTVPGFHNNVTSWDASSLYPTLVRVLNISPETKIGMAYDGKGQDAFLPDDDSIIKIVTVKGLEYKLTYENFKKFINENNLTLAANGCIFRQDIEGLLPQYMREIYSDRKAARDRIKKNNKKIEEYEKQLAEKEDPEVRKEMERLLLLNEQEDILQYALKIAINSAYGAISSRKNPIGDDDLANAITVSGSQSIKQVAHIVKKFFVKKELEVINRKIKSYEKVS